jgi:trimethylamine--corrinoid protein Co-methyltransferase
MGSFATGAKTPNWQAGIDNSLSTFMASVVMSDMLLGVGLLHGSRIWSYEQLMMDCEIFNIVHKMMEGIEVNGETLAVDVINQVGSHGNYLTQRHTRDHMHDIWVPRYMDRRPYEVWLETGDGPRDWARAEAIRIYEQHEPDILDPDISRE